MTEQLRLTAPLPAVVQSVSSLTAAVQELMAGSGPLGVDAERAGSYRYSQRAYLVQIYRRGAPVLLLDPLGVDDLSALAEVLGGDLWVMQAAHNDLECLAELGLRPGALFDTEIAAQLLGLERVGLGSLVETQLGYAMRKSHGQADWSRRPLRRSWLEYAALDVTVLPDLQDALAEHLSDTGKTGWAEQEFAHQLRERPVPDPTQRWRRTGGAGKLRTDVQRGALRQLWTLRDELARARDVAWHRIVRDQVLVEMARRLPANTDELAGIPGVPRPVVRNGQQWVAAVGRGSQHPEPPAERPDGPPARSLRAWEQRDPAAAARWVDLRSRLAERAEELQVWTQILLAPDIVAMLAWEPPADPVARMRELGARPWQIENTHDLLQ
ncbi:MAG TPA: HRDC domain-containing protein [Actinomycetota bacterium]|nr:HRDC domain-containing protein [Actinomycetota bacterium]